MGSFKRFDGFTGSIPQKFIDKQLPKCPMCSTTDPHWTLLEKIGFTNNHYLFKCDKCGCILSSTVADVTGFARSPITTMGIVKALSGKKMSVIYMKVVDVGSAQVTQTYKDKEFDLKDLQKMADDL